MVREMEVSDSGFLKFAEEALELVDKLNQEMPEQRPLVHVQNPDGFTVYIAHPEVLVLCSLKGKNVQDHPD